MVQFYVYVEYCTLLVYTLMCMWKLKRGIKEADDMELGNSSEIKSTAYITQDSGSIPSSHLAAHTIFNSGSRGYNTLLGHYGLCMYTVHRHVNRETFIHIR